MKSIASVAAIAVLVACAMAMAPQSPKSQARVQQGPPVDQAATYEHLATAIIAIRETENSLVHGMLVSYLASARAHLVHAAGASGADRTRMLEAASAEITNLANEGDKRIQAVRQRLLKAGHHHHTDAETQDDYMFIDSREKKALLEFAGEVARMRQSSAEDIRAAAERLDGLAEEALKSE